MKTYKVKFGYLDGNQKKSVFIIVHADNEEEAKEIACSMLDNSYSIENIESADFE